MIEWIPCELHTHTIHSDGSLTLLELAREARKLELQCIALTDHNTIAGQLEIPFVTKETGLNIVPGMEWTTFYGHMVAMGIKKYVDWRDVMPEDIHRGIAAIHEAGGLAGVAHPYRMGSPMCTGCYWQFHIKDWKDVDYLEVWSETFPSIKPVNHRAFELWTELLNEGHKLTAVSGRDWHRNGSGKEPIAVTYLGIEGSNDKDFYLAMIDAISAGRAVATMGPMLRLSAALAAYEQNYNIGDVVILSEKDSKLEFRIEIDFSARRHQWTLDPEPLKAALMSNKGKLGETMVTTENRNVSGTVPVESLKWIRAELYGKVLGIDCMIGFTNPIYFR